MGKYLSIYLSCIYHLSIHLSQCLFSPFRRERVDSKNHIFKTLSLCSYVIHKSFSFRPNIRIGKEILLDKEGDVKCLIVLLVMTFQELLKVTETCICTHVHTHTRTWTIFNWFSNYLEAVGEIQSFIHSSIRTLLKHASCCSRGTKSVQFVWLARLGGHHRQESFNYITKNKNEENWASNILLLVHFLITHRMLTVSSVSGRET